MSKLVLDYQKLNKEYPNAVKRIEKWFSHQKEIIEGMKNVGADVRGVLEHFVGMIIQYDPRRLYDTFDQMGIEIYIGPYPGAGWTYGTNIEDHTTAAASRIEAEIEGFTLAFKLLEAKEVENE